MREVGAFAAKTHLSELLAAVEKGETITITRRGRPVARLAPIDDVAAKRAKAFADLARLQKTMPLRATMDEVLEWIAEGRK
jgi:prevent-host-death family protein